MAQTNQYELVENPFEGVESPLTKLARIAIMSVNSNRDGARGYRTKMASNNPEKVESAVCGAFLDGFYETITKEASYSRERAATTELGSMLGLEFLLNMKEALVAE